MPESWSLGPGPVPPQILYSLSGNWIETQTFDLVIATDITTINLNAPAGSSLVIAAVTGDTISFTASNRGLVYGGGLATTITPPQAHTFTGIAADASGNASGGTNNFIGGAGAGTGIPGAPLQFNGHATCVFAPCTGMQATQTIFVCTQRNLLLSSVSLVFTTAAGFTSTMQITHETGTQAPGTGTPLLVTPFNMNGTPNTTQTGTLLTANQTNLAALTLAPGDRLSATLPNTILDSSGICVTLGMVPW